MHNSCWSKQTADSNNVTATTGQFVLNSFQGPPPGGESYSFHGAGGPGGSSAGLVRHPVPLPTMFSVRKSPKKCDIHYSALVYFTKKLIDLNFWPKAGDW